MECLNLKNEYYKGRMITMANNKKIKKKIMEVLSIVAALGVVVGIVAFFMNMQNSINLLTKELEEQSRKVDTMHNYIYFDENNINSQLASVNLNINSLQGQLDIINEALNIKIITVTDASTISAIDGMITQSYSENYVSPILLSSAPIGTDIYGELYYVEDLVDESMLLTYEEDGKEVYFLGQYNEDYNWDGYCVTNSYYLDGTLYGICESNFDNGVRQDYKSLYLSEENNWILSDRICEGDTNIGKTVEYVFEYNDLKNFTKTNVRRTDILYVENFIENVGAKMIKQFYYGKTVNQRYNDDSGKAYLIKYNSDGTIKTLYVGNFVDGYCEDNTGNAWNIVYSSELQNYFYNTGEFKNNSAVKKSTQPITIEEIEEIISNYSFACELKWKIDNI